MANCSLDKHTNSTSVMSRLSPIKAIKRCCCSMVNGIVQHTEQNAHILNSEVVIYNKQMQKT